MVVPCPEAFAIPVSEMEPIIQAAEEEARARGISGKELTPFLLGRVAEVTEGRSLAANRALLLNNAEVAAAISVAFSSLYT